MSIGPVDPLRVYAAAGPRARVRRRRSSGLSPSMRSRLRSSRHWPHSRADAAASSFASWSGALVQAIGRDVNRRDPRAVRADGGRPPYGSARRRGRERRAAGPERPRTMQADRERHPLLSKIKFFAKEARCTAGERNLSTGSSHKTEHGLIVLASGDIRGAHGLSPA